MKYIVAYQSLCPFSPGDPASNTVFFSRETILTHYTISVGGQHCHPRTGKVLGSGGRSIRGPGTPPPSPRHCPPPSSHHLCGRALCGPSDQQISTRSITPSQARDHIPRPHQPVVYPALPPCDASESVSASGFPAIQNPERSLDEDRSYGVGQSRGTLLQGECGPGEGCL